MWEGNKLHILHCDGKLGDGIYMGAVAGQEIVRDGEVMLSYNGGEGQIIVQHNRQSS